MNPHLNDLTYETIGAAIEVHRVLGPGLLESTYRDCLCRELSLRGISFRRECGVPLQYKGIQVRLWISCRPSGGKPRSRRA